MYKSVARFLPVFLLFALSFVLGACQKKAVVTSIPVINVEEIVAKGDSDFQRPHLTGWRKAESLYQKAYGLEASDQIRDKLLLTRFLILTREIDEDIPDPAMERAFEDLCSQNPTPRQKVLCDLARRYKAGTRAEPVVPKEPAGRTLLDAQDSPLEAYLYTLYAQAHGIKETNETAGARAERFRDSPLFIYLYLGKKTSQRAEEIERAFPDFAELSDFMGGALFQKNRYTGAKAYYNKAIELIPDYTRSLNGLGNICLFALEDYETALEYYQRSLKCNPDNAAALFGAGRIFHSLGKFAESNDLLDRMLQSDLSRSGHTSEDAVRYYQGEANYYKAYNFHLSGNPEKAREFIEIAKEYLPRSDHINYLSGLLYYQGKELRDAKDDFLRVVQGGSSNCDAQYYLGRIYRESKEELDEQPPEKTAGVRIPQQLAEYLDEIPVQNETRDRRSLNYFLGACSCMESNVRGMEGQIRSVPSMDLDAGEKVLLEGRLKNKLLNYRRSSRSLIDGMLHLSSGAEADTRDTYLNLMKEVQERIGPGDNSALSSPNRP